MAGAATTDTREAAEQAVGREPRGGWGGADRVSALRWRGRLVSVVEALLSVDGVRAEWTGGTTAPQGSWYAFLTLRGGFDVVAYGGGSCGDSYAVEVTRDADPGTGGSCVAAEVAELRGSLSDDGCAERAARWMRMGSAFVYGEDKPARHRRKTQG